MKMMAIRIILVVVFCIPAYQSQGICTDMFVELLKKDNILDEKYIIFPLKTPERFMMEKQMLSQSVGMLTLIYLPPRPSFLSIVDPRTNLQKWVYCSKDLPYTYFSIVIDKNDPNDAPLKKLLSSFVLGYSRGYGNILQKMNSKTLWDETTLELFYKKSKYPKFYQENPDQKERESEILFQMRKHVDYKNIKVNHIGSYIPIKKNGSKKFENYLKKEFAKIGSEIVKIYSNNPSFEVNLKDPEIEKYDKDFKALHPNKLTLSMFLRKYYVFILGEINIIMPLVSDEEKWMENFSIGADIIANSLEFLVPLLDDELHSIFNFLCKTLNERDFAGNRNEFVRLLENIDGSLVKKATPEQKFDRFYNFIFGDYIMLKFKNWDNRKNLKPKFTKAIVKLLHRFVLFLQKYLPKIDLEQNFVILNSNIKKEIEDRVSNYIDLKLDYLTTIFIGSSPGLIEFYFSTLQDMQKRIKKYHEQHLFSNETLFGKQDNQNISKNLLHQVSLLGCNTPENDSNEYKSKYFQLNRNERLKEVAEMKKTLESMKLKTLI